MWPLLSNFLHESPCFLGVNISTIIRRDYYINIIKLISLIKLYNVASAILSMKEKCKHGMTDACFKCDYPGQMENYYRIHKEQGWNA